jgi:hypothetical protein
MGSWLPAEMKKDTPADFQFSAFPFPSVAGSSVNQTEQDVWATADYILIQGPNKDVAVEYLKLWSSKQMQEQHFVPEVGDLSPLKAVKSSPDFDPVLKLITATDHPVSQYLGVNVAQPELFANGYRPTIDKLFLGQLKDEKFLQAMADERDRLLPYASLPPSVCIFEHGQVWRGGLRQNRSKPCYSCPPQSITCRPPLLVGDHVL